MLLSAHLAKPFRALIKNQSRREILNSKGPRMDPCPNSKKFSPKKYMHNLFASFANVNAATLNHINHDI